MVSRRQSINCNCGVVTPWEDCLYCDGCVSYWLLSLPSTLCYYVNSNYIIQNLVTPLYPGSCSWRAQFGSPPTTIYVTIFSTGRLEVIISPPSTSVFTYADTIFSGDPPFNCNGVVNTQLQFESYSQPLMCLGSYPPYVVLSGFNCE